MTSVLRIAAILISLPVLTPTSQSRHPMSRLSIVSPRTSPAGRTVTVQVETASPDGTVVALVTMGTDGIDAQRAALRGGRAAFQLPETDTAYAGVMTLIASAGHVSVERSLRVTPLAPASPLLPLVGPRRAVADRHHDSMAVVVPLDRLGNVVAAGTKVQIRALHPGNRLQAAVVRVAHLVAWDWLPTGTRAGRTSVGIHLKGVYGPETGFLETPGPPASFHISASPATLPADGHSILTLSTGMIHDRFGNVVEDGTYVTFILDNPHGGRTVIPAYTADGVAAAPFQAPAAPASFTASAVSFGATSNRVRIVFTAGPAVGRFPVTLTFNRAHRTLIALAGPILGPLSQYVPDGIPVTFTLTAPGHLHQTVTSQTQSGYARAAFIATTMAAGSYRITARAGSGTGSAATPR